MKSKEDFLKRHPACWRCMLAHKDSTKAEYVIKNLRGNVEPVCEDHYRQFCVGFGMMLQQAMLNPDPLAGWRIARRR